jgi:uncharacterized protein YggE
MMRQAVRKGVIAFVLIAVFSCFACARERPQPRLITVTGAAEVRVTPDETTLTLGVETVNRDLGIAKRQNDERVKRVFALAKRYNVVPGNFWTDRVSVEPRYRGGDAREELIGYRVHKTIVLTVRDVSRLDDLLNSVLDAGANYIYGVQFRTTKLHDYRDEARALALKAAKEKAKVMAKELGQKVGRPYAIVEEGNEEGTAPAAMPSTSVSMVEADKSVAIGQMSISARVRVSFELR